MAWLRLMRWSNLLIILLTQCVVWFCVILPLSGDVALVLTAPAFAGLCVSTILIAAAGYIINDYFDLRIDRINKPEEMVLGKGISRRQAILSHLLLNTIALLLAAKVAIKASHPEWLLLQLACIVLLWFYSTHFKRQFVTGNFIVALLTAFTIVVLYVYEPQLYLRNNALHEESEYWLSPAYVMFVFTGFAFLMTWMREIVKDMEDLKGDLQEGCETMPIRWGLKRSSHFVQWIGLLTLLALTISATYLWLIHFWFTAALTVLCILIPLAFWMYKLPKRATTAHYKIASRQLKFLMVIGILLLFIIYLRNNQYFPF